MAHLIWVCSVVFTYCFVIDIVCYVQSIGDVNLVMFYHSGVLIKMRCNRKDKSTYLHKFENSLLCCTFYKNERTATAETFHNMYFMLASWRWTVTNLAYMYILTTRCILNPHSYPVVSYETRMKNSISGTGDASGEIMTSHLWESCRRGYFFFQLGAIIPLWQEA